jgi:hypothetical protein
MEGVVAVDAVPGEIDGVGEDKEGEEEMGEVSYWSVEREG